MSVYTTAHKIASPLLYHAGLYQRIWRARCLREPFSFAVIYHRVVSDDASGSTDFDIEKGISASQFEQQMRFLLQHFSPVPASRIQTALRREVQFAVTLDDGYEDNFQVAAPILRKLGIPATFYVVSDFVGTDRLFWWEQIAELMRAPGRTGLDLGEVIPDLCRSDDRAAVLPMRNHAERNYAYEQLCAHIRSGTHESIPAHVKRIAEYFDVPVREQGRRYGLMTWQQLTELVGQGFEIGGHSANHCNVVGADEAQLRRELVASANTIEAGIDAPVESFAYPYGMFEASNKRVVSMLDQTNCKVAFTTVQGVVRAGSPAYELPRTQLNRPYRFACAFNVQNALASANIPAQ